MDFLASLVTIIVVALVLAAAITFGLILLAWIVGIGVAVAIAIMLRNAWYRWRHGPPQHIHTESHSDIIEVEYQDISDKDKP